jgi:hypothetical protein
MSVVNTRPQPAPEQSEQTEHQTPVKSVEGISLAELIQRARNAVGEERAWLCTLVNRALVAISTAADKDRQAALVLEMLDDEALHGLVDEREVACRAVAVEALLTIGYPWALQLEPVDVEFLREHPATSKRVIPFGRVAGGAAGLGSAALLGVSMVGMRGWWASQLLHSPTDLALVLALATTMLTSFSLVFRRPFLTPARWAMFLSSLVAGMVVVADAITRPPSPIHFAMLLVPALGALGAVLRDKSTT